MMNVTCGDAFPRPAGAVCSIDGEPTWGGASLRFAPGYRPLPLRGKEEQLCESIDLASLHFSVAEAADFGVGFDGFGAVRASAGAHQVTEGPFFKGSLVVFNHLLDALRIPLGVAVAVNLVGSA